MPEAFDKTAILLGGMKPVAMMLLDMITSSEESWNASNKAWSAGFPVVAGSSIVPSGGGNALKCRLVVHFNGWTTPENARDVVRRLRNLVEKGTYAFAGALRGGPDGRHTPFNVMRTPDGSLAIGGTGDDDVTMAIYPNAIVGSMFSPRADGKRYMQGYENLTDAFRLELLEGELCLLGAVSRLGPREVKRFEKPITVSFNRVSSDLLSMCVDVAGLFEESWLETFFALRVIPEHSRRMSAVMAGVRMTLNFILARAETGEIVLQRAATLDASATEYLDELLVGQASGTNPYSRDDYDREVQMWQAEGSAIQHALRGRRAVLR